MSTINAIELEKLLLKNSSLTLVDVRTPAEFENAHIENSVNIPLNQLKANVFKDQNVYLLCQKGSRAQQAAKLFEKEGLQAVVLDGGVSAWIEAGFKVQKGSSTVISLERQVRIGAGSLILLGVILAKFVHPGFIWLSALVGAGLINAGLTDWCGMGLLIARLPWNQSSKVK